MQTLTCVDGSAGMLDVLRRKHAGRANVRLQQCDLEQAHDDDGFQADVVYWFGLLEHIIDTQTFLRNCRRMIGRGGRIVFAAPNGRCPWYGPLRRVARPSDHLHSNILVPAALLRHLPL